MNDLDIVTRLRMYAEDLHSAGGFNGYASAMSLAADEIVKLREYVEMMDKDMIATIEQRDELDADKARWMRMSEAGPKPDYCCIVALDAARARAWKDRNTRCGCDHNESCAECFPPAFDTGGYWDQQRALLQQSPAQPEGEK